MKTQISDLIGCVNIYKGSFLCLEELTSRVFYVKGLIRLVFICKIT